MKFDILKIGIILVVFSLVWHPMLSFVVHKSFKVNHFNSRVSFQPAEQGSHEMRVVETPAALPFLDSPWRQPSKKFTNKDKLWCVINVSHRTVLHLLLLPIHLQYCNLKPKQSCTSTQIQDISWILYNRIPLHGEGHTCCSCNPVQ